MVKGEKRVWSGHSWTHFSRGESGGNSHLKWPQEFQTDYHEAKTPENWFKPTRNAACMVKNLQCNNIKNIPRRHWRHLTPMYAIYKLIASYSPQFLSTWKADQCQAADFYFFILFTRRSFSITRTFHQVEVKVAASPRLLRRLWRLEPQIKVCEMFAERSCCWEQNSGRTWWW